MDPISRKLLFKTRESTISFVAADAVAGTSGAVTLTGKGMVDGDLMLAFTIRDGSATPPTLPAGWTTLLTNSSTNGGLAAYKIFNSATDTTVTFTNATTTVFVAYRGIDTTTPIGNTLLKFNLNSEITELGPLNLVDTTSWVVGAVFTISGTTGNVVFPTGWTARASAEDATDSGFVGDSNNYFYEGSFPVYTQNNGSGNDTLNYTVEIRSKI